MAAASNSFCRYGGALPPTGRPSPDAAGVTTCSFRELHGRRGAAATPICCALRRVDLLPQLSSGVLSQPSLSISETFANLKKQRKVAFIPYITAGDPDLSTTAEALKVLDACGSKTIELGVPCNDPFADGPVIQASAARARARGTTFDRVISMLKEVIPQISCPITLFSYYNPILKYGVSKFLMAMNSVNVRGLIIPDLPFEQIETFKKEAKKNQIELVLIMTPTTQIEQTKAIVKASEGFLYLASHSGATGARSSINPEVESVLRRIKKLTRKPISIGFGISKPEHVKQLSAWGADGVIVGSAIVKLLGEAKSAIEGLREMEAYARSLTSVLN